MSHNVEYRRYPLHVSKEKVKNDLDNYVAQADWQEGCCGLYHPIRWLSDKTYNSMQEAMDAIERLDRGGYDNLAVQFIQSEAISDAKYKELSKKADEAEKEFERRDSALYPDSVTSALISCKYCGSKLSRVHLKMNACPVCGHDLRPEYILKSVETARSKWNKARENAVNYLNRHSKKDTMWLVKFEYHT